MQLHLIKSDDIYRELLVTPIEQREELFKNKLLLPFKKKFELQYISFNNSTPFNV